MIPLLISSECVSVHLPLSVWTSVVLPWSTCPTMPMLSCGWVDVCSGCSDSSFFCSGSVFFSSTFSIVSVFVSVFFLRAIGLLI